MQLDPTTLIGLVAAVLTTGALVPQVVKTWQTRSTGDLSLTMYAMMFTGVILWLVYGLIQHDLPLILANGIATCLSSVILFFKIKESKAGK